ncbi:hypothetical protein P280DRAFT_387023, partial [Massarina eburnea CBS 473.64]
HIDVYLLADRYHVPGLKQLSIEKFEARAAVLSRVVYATTRCAGEDDLRKVVVKLCADHSRQYILQGANSAAKMFKLIDELPAFRNDFIHEMESRLK